MPRLPAQLPSVAVIVGAGAPEIERYAAEQLCAYLAALFGIATRPVSEVSPTAEALLVVGAPATNSAVAPPFPAVSPQGIVLQRRRVAGRPALVIGGGSPVATLWAVYELAQRWGVHYLLHGDVLPERRPFALPDLDLSLEPLLPVREWRVINDFACGHESWGMADYRPLLDQLAKRKFNRLLVSLWPWQPFLHYQQGGISRRSAWLWFDYHYPLTEDMVGRSLFGQEPEFWNPDLPRGASYAELTAAGLRLVHDLIDYAHRRGMECDVAATLTEFPPEFTPLLPGAQKVRQLGELTVVPGPATPVDDPALIALATTVLRATVDTYPEADRVILGMPEFRQWADQYERAWQALDRRYGLEAVRPLQAILAAAAERRDYPGGSERALQEVKGDLVALYFYDYLLCERRVLEGSARPDMPFVLSGVAEELYPLLARLLPPGSEALNFVDYTAGRIVKRRGVLSAAPSRALPCTLIYTLHDDNVGLLPQLATGSLHELTCDLRRHGWAGFATRYWLIGDHDPCLAYLSAAAWDAEATPAALYRDQIRTCCGKDCVADMLDVFRIVEATTLQLEWHGLGFAFPVPGMLLKQWQPESLPPALEECRRGYEQALAAARRALGKARPGGEAYVAYWVGRLEFGAGYLEAVGAVRAAAKAEAEGRPEEALRWAEIALRTARQALAAYARVARDQSDRGALAVLNEYVYRPLRAQVARLAAH